NTPDDLLVDSPVRNVWLNAWDNFTVANIVGIDRRAYTRSAVKLKWSPENLRVAAATVAGLVTVSNARAEYAWWQADALFSVYRGIYVEIDTRLARYDKPSWQRTSTFASGYAEVGYRGRYVEINIGYGFDPRVFDFVINEFAHIGRTEVLRASVADGALRSEAAEIGRKLLDQEQALENNHSIKLETIIRF
ncbi:MAG: hypothetical protein IH969_09860, partial [Candidatus Krumholzibacteriota bacterium]|nr:hypothetical protein [Candidatus Krumholzibacteriota bacterium]